MGVIELKNVSFTYPNNPVIKNMDYEFQRGLVYCITGKSGAGKTTLLSMLSGIMDPTSGYIVYNGYPIDESDRYVYRSRDVGVIFQEYNLLPKFTVRENIQLSLDISGKKLRDLDGFGTFSNKKDYVDQLIREVGLDPEEVGNRRILKISGGQQQRIAIARALSFQPGVILADEPTGNLDIDTSIDIMNVFLHLAHELNRCVIIVTHSPQIADLADVRLDLKPLSRYKKV
ncbi:ABC transporter ATP-binding protein [Ruminococcus difficilis]|uniref:ABC transporter ATP-binding protein n=1 Tax=Ruminococcus difficilis TaxID=2763069 RepID=A0A934TYX3_9FIRM|nr:ABC transporter ATP-binding protein [Ruminococcus difficilis]MBK6088082.1 ABC transporter ATP-binding protein [Ruminococcus difficilis]